MHEIGRINLSLEAAADLDLGEQAQVIAIDLEQFAEGRVASGAGACDGLLGIHAV